MEEPCLAVRLSWRQAVCSLTLLAHAAEPTLLHVNTFPTARSLPFYVAVDRGFFARRGLKVELEFTESSERQRQGLAGGTVDIVHSAVDNAVAMIDVAKVDIVIVSGGDSGTNEFYVQDDDQGLFRHPRQGHRRRRHQHRLCAAGEENPGAARAARTAPTIRSIRSATASGGLTALFDDKNNAGAILNLPYSLQAAAKGMRSLGRTTDMLGPYQAGGAFVRRAWARDNAATLENYLAAFVEALRWSLDPKNHAEAAAILVDKLKLPQDVAEKSLALMAEPGFGFARDAAFDMAGFKNVLALRAEVEGGAPSDPQRYIDLSYYDRAMTLVSK